MRLAADASDNAVTAAPYAGANPPVSGPVGVIPPASNITPEQQLSLAALRAALPHIESAHMDALEIVDRFRDELVCIDCEWNTETGVLETVGIGNERIIVQFAYGAPPFDDEFHKHEIRFAVEQLVQTVPVVYHSAISDLKKLRENGFKVHPATHLQLEDTMLADAVVNAEEDHDLGSLNERHGKLPPYKDLMKVAPREYNAGDVVAPVLLWKYYYAVEFAKDPAAEAVYREQSLAFLAEIQIETEEAGIRVDKSRPYPLWDKYSQKREQAVKLAQAYSGWPINLGSPDDMKHALYTVEGMPPQFEKGPPQAEKKVTSDKDAVAALRRFYGTEWDADEEATLDSAWAAIDAGGHPLLEARYLFLGAQQALSHYIKPFFVVEGEGPKAKIVGVKDRIFPEIRQHVQASGRHSFVDPPLQQLKGALIDDPLAKGGKTPELQTQITPDAGTVWVGHDWSNIETWLLGYLADDEQILEAKRHGWDTHVINFCDLSGTEYPPLLTKALHDAPEAAEWRALLKWQGEDDIRRVFSKRGIYRTHYRGDPAGMGDIPGAKALGFVGERMTAAINRYLSKHPAIPAFWAKTDTEVDRFSKVYTFDGRPRRSVSKYRNAKRRELTNQKLQGGVAGIYITSALMVKRAAPYARFVWGAHDSMWFQIPAERKVEFLALYKPIVEREFDVNGHKAVFPASYKERQAA